MQLSVHLAARSWQVDMQLSAHFHLSEFVQSDTAKAMGLSNVPPPEVVRRLQMLCHRVLEPLRARLLAPIHVSSGYRSPAVNGAVGGSPSSQHMHGEAVDIWTGAMDARDLKVLITQCVPEWDQLYLHEIGNFVHVSYRVGNNRKQILPDVT